MGVFARILIELADQGAETGTVMIDVSRRTPCVRVSLRKYLKAHRTASSLRANKGGRGRAIGRTKGGMNTKLHAICDAVGRPLRMFLTAGPPSRHIASQCPAGQRDQR